MGMGVDEHNLITGDISMKPYPEISIWAELGPCEIHKAVLAVAEDRDLGVLGPLSPFGVFHGGGERPLTSLFLKGREG